LSSILLMTFLRVFGYGIYQGLVYLWQSFI
jgi:hypothetical protein